MESGQDLSFEGKRVAIGGIGRAAARRFDRAGASLVLIDLDGARLADLAREFGPQAQWFCCDQRQPAAIEHTVAAFGAVDVFVNNAGIIIRKALLDMTAAETADLLAVNMTGSILMAVGMARHMTAKRSG